MNAEPRVRRRRWSDSAPRDGWFPVLVITLLIAALDWSTKLIVAATVPLGGRVVVWEERLALWHVRNPEMVLGLWGNLPLESRQVIAVVGAVLAILLFYEIVERGHRLAPHRRFWAWLFVGLACGGMLGNLGERAVHWYVTDFLSFHWGGLWLPPANFADLAIFLAIPAAIPVIFFELHARSRRGTQAARAEYPPQAAVAERGAAMDLPSPLAREKGS
jgi:signal peptidase II